MQVVAAFPAGTLSGAPKHRAMQLKNTKKQIVIFMVVQ
jgi:anthranilate/para-aminobenzoate synthase component I